MSVSNIHNATSEMLLQSAGWRLRAQSRTLAGDITLAENAAPIQILNNGGAVRNVDLPDTSKEGLSFVIRNDAGGAFIITVRNEADAAVGTLAATEWAIFTQIGGVWLQVAGGTTV